MTSSDSKVSKIQTHFQALSETASSLNAASDELTQTVALLDESLKKLNVGLSAWVSFRSRDNDDDPYEYDVNQIGYCKVNGTWGIALRHIWGHEGLDRHSEDGPWLFNDASREMRLASVDKIPDVIEELAKVAASTTKKIQEKAKEVRELTTAIRPASKPAPKKDALPAFAQGGVQGSSRTVPLANLLKGNEGSK